VHVWNDAEFDKILITSLVLLKIETKKCSFIKIPVLSNLLQFKHTLKVNGLDFMFGNLHSKVKSNFNVLWVVQSNLIGQHWLLDYGTPNYNMKSKSMKNQAKHINTPIMDFL